MGGPDGILFKLFSLSVVVIVWYLLFIRKSKCPTCGRPMREEMGDTGLIRDGNSVIIAKDVRDYCNGNPESNEYWNSLDEKVESFKKPINNDDYYNDNFNDNNRVSDRLKVLTNLKKENLITEKEFEEKKAELLKQL